VESEAQSLGNEVTNKPGDRYDQTSQNGSEDLGECFKSNKKGKIMTYVSTSTKKNHSAST
jgi:hypothetical protein